MGEEKRIYPIIKNEKEVEQMVNDNIIIKIWTLRDWIIWKKKKKLQDLLLRYEHVRNSWSKADSIVKIVGAFILFSVSTGLITISNGGALIPLAALKIAETILGSMIAFSSSLTVGTNIWYIRNEKKRILC